MIENWFGLAGKVALVTGGNGGLGRAMALGLQAAGARVFVTGRNRRKNEAMAAELEDPAGMLPLDVRDEAAVERAIDGIIRRCGRLDILVNNAGGAHGSGILELSREDWAADIDTHLTGAFLCAKHAARAMVAGGRGGKIINIGSMYSVFGTASGVGYAAAKAGLLGLTRGLAVELAPHQIQVNAILPGWHWSELTEGLRGSARAEEIRRKTPAGRWGTGEDLVGAAVFLASAASDFITGAALAVDGGYAVMEKLAAA